jgi:hypothetical protein
MEADQALANLATVFGSAVLADWERELAADEERPAQQHKDKQTQAADHGSAAP